MSAEWVAAAKVADVGAGKMVPVAVGDKNIAVYNLNGTFYATDNECTHAFAMLTDGTVDGEIVECPLHGGAFEIKTGKGLGAPIFCDIRTYPTRVSGDTIEVNVAD